MPLTLPPGAGLALSTTVPGAHGLTGQGPGLWTPSATAMGTGGRSGPFSSSGHPFITKRAGWDWPSSWAGGGPHCALPPGARAAHSLGDAPKPGPRHLPARPAAFVLTDTSLHLGGSQEIKRNESKRARCFLGSV